MCRHRRHALIDTFKWLYVCVYTILARGWSIEPRDHWSLCAEHLAKKTHSGASIYMVGLARRSTTHTTAHTAHFCAPHLSACISTSCSPLAQFNWLESAQTHTQTQTGCMSTPSVCYNTKYTRAAPHLTQSNDLWAVFVWAWLLLGCFLQRCEKNQSALERTTWNSAQMNIEVNGHIDLSIYMDRF